MSFFRKHKNILIFVGILVLVFVGYLLFFPGGGGGNAELETESATGLSEGGAQQSELVSLLLNLQSVELDTSLFSDPAFQSLQDFSTQLSPQPVGRDNPFSPIGADNTAPTDDAAPGADGAVQ